MERVSKVEIARIQIEKAIDLYVVENNFISAITLAGAAEEILGKLLKLQGKSSSYDGIREVLNASHRQLSLQELDSLSFNEIANGTRNHLKHLSGLDYVEKNFKQEACNIIHRAICNYSGLFYAGHEMKGATEKMINWVNSKDLSPTYPIGKT